MKTSRILAVLTVSSVFACVPDLNTKASRVVQTRVVAVQATPAEATPRQMVTWQAVVVSPLSATAAPQIDWAMCLSPRNPADSITVSAACFGVADAVTVAGAAPLVTTLAGAAGSVVQGTIPSDACRKIGPEVSAMSMGGTRQRPPDADITGGYQLPLRLVVSENGALEDISFDRQRVRCNLASAPADAARDYAARYKNNQNPSIDSIDLPGFSGAADGSARYHVPLGAKIPLLIRWSAGAQETYVLFDPVERAIVERTETLDVSWYTNGGEFSRDRTTQDPGQPSSSNTLELDSDITQPVTVWVILRDERGGVGLGQLTLDLD